MKRWLMFLISAGVILIMVFIGIYLKTGFLQTSSINEKDLGHWNYTSDGNMDGAKEFILAGDEGVCWLLIHGYTSTPDEMKELAFRINSEFNETVVVPRLEGHGEMPSAILNLTLDDWYKQIEGEYEIMDDNCGSVNVVGFSFGGAIALRLAEERDVGNLYVLATYLKSRYKWFRIFPSEIYLDIFSDWTIYSKKITIGQINSEEGLNKHLSYWNMPFQPVKYSKSFFNNVADNLHLINESILIQHSVNDETADISGSELILDQVKSEIKEMITFSKSNHILTEDYDKNEVMDNIINFENARRT